MSEAEIRRNARRQKILQNSEQRLQKLAKEEQSCKGEIMLYITDVTAVCEESHCDKPDIFCDIARNKDINIDTNISSVQHRFLAGSGRTLDFCLDKSQGISQITDDSPPETMYTRSVISSPKSHKNGEDFKSSEWRYDCVSRDASWLDMIHPVACIMLACLTCQTLRTGYGEWFFEWIFAPFIAMEACVFVFKRIFLQVGTANSNNSMAVYALLMSGIKPSIIGTFTYVMTYVTELAEDCAVYLFAFLACHTLMSQ